MQRPSCGGIVYTLSSAPSGVSIDSVNQILTVTTVTGSTAGTYSLTLYGSLTAGTVTTSATYSFNVIFVDRTISYIAPPTSISDIFYTIKDPVFTI